MDFAELARAVARGLHMAGSYALFGTILLTAFLVPADAEPQVIAALKRFAWGSLAVTLAAGAAWLLLQAADMASATDFNDMLTALPIVIRSTRFGHVLILRMILSVGAACCFQWRYFRLAAALGGIAVLAEAWLGHGAAMSGGTGAILLVSSLVHLAGGAAWIGSLPALLIAIAKLPQRAAAKVAKQYSPLGIACVLAIVISALIQFILLIGSAAALMNTLYGRVACLKILALAALIGLAAANRYRLAPALLRLQYPDARNRMLWSIGFEIVLGMTALLAAGLLLNLAPPTMAAMLRMQQ